MISEHYKIESPEDFMKMLVAEIPVNERRSRPKPTSYPCLCIFHTVENRDGDMYFIDYIYPDDIFAQCYNTSYAGAVRAIPEDSEKS